MMRATLVPCGDDAAAAGEAARIVTRSIKTAGPRGWGLALSGGRIAAAFFDGLVAQAGSQGVAWDHVGLFWADERLVPPDDPESNFQTARARLIEPLGLAAGQVHRIAGELAPAEATASANLDWAAWRARRTPSTAGPDCVVLGVGEDGHVASLFPRNLTADLAATEPFRFVLGPKPPPARITMGYALLRSAAEMVILATGSGKERVVSGSLDGTLDTPLARILAGRDPARTWLVTPFPVG